MPSSFVKPMTEKGFHSWYRPVWKTGYINIVRICGRMLIEHKTGCQVMYIHANVLTSSCIDSAMARTIEVFPAPGRPVRRRAETACQWYNHIIMATTLKLTAVYNIDGRMLYKFPETKIGATFQNVINTSQRHWCLRCAFRSKSEQVLTEDITGLLSSKERNEKLTRERCQQKSCGWIFWPLFQNRPKAGTTWGGNNEAIKFHRSSKTETDLLHKIPLLYGIWKGWEHHMIFWYTLCTPHI